MRRGTTPTVAVHVHDNISDLKIHLSFKVGCALVVKKGNDLTVTTEVIPEETVDGEVIPEHTVTHIVTTLTQEETLSFKSGKECEVQIRAYTDAGAIALATTIGTIPVKRILEEGVLSE